MNERSRRGITIGASVAAVLGLLAVMGAFVVERVADEEATTSTTSTTTSTTSTTSTTVPETTTTVGVPAIANAGVDQAVDRGAAVQLAAVGIAAGTPDASIAWAQTSGPDVTAGAGTLAGPTPTFTAPDDVTTVVFDLTVTGTDGTTAADTVVVRVFEDSTQMVFVDGELGDDEAGDGTVFAPFRSLRHGIEAAEGSDVYVRSVGTYDVSDAALAVDATTSIYGGYDEAWLRERQSATYKRRTA